MSARSRRKAAHQRRSRLVQIAKALNDQLEMKVNISMPNGASIEIHSAHITGFSVGESTNKGSLSLIARVDSGWATTYPRQLSVTETTS